uniref:Uncharacterized protein n=1 Tax=Romanomermis culicivorax TaxID=13658 RepID=A0A915IA15_ROMCU
MPLTTFNGWTSYPTKFHFVLQNRMNALDITMGTLTTDATMATVLKATPKNANFLKYSASLTFSATTGSSSFEEEWTYFKVKKTEKRERLVSYTVLRPKGQRTEKIIEKIPKKDKKLSSKDKQ